jgi:hypothetical protein
MRKILALASLLIVAACSGTQTGPSTADTVIAKTATGASQVTDKLIADIGGIVNTTTPDLQNALAVASVKLTTGAMADPDGVPCLQAVINVQSDAINVLKAANATGSGLVTSTELASIFAPNSPTYNAEKQVLQAGCAAKALDVGSALGQSLSAVGNLGALIPVLAPAISSVAAGAAVAIP